MNIKLSAKIKADLKNDKNEIIETRIIIDKFSTIQTPTEITKKILNSDNKIRTYIEYINERMNEDYIENIYSVDDIFEEDEPIAITKGNHATDHINELNDFINNHKYWELCWYEV
jgi:uncharacterized membrane protein